MEGCIYCYSFTLHMHLLYFAWANQRRRQYYIHHTEPFLNELYYIRGTLCGNDASAAFRRRKSTQTVTQKQLLEGRSASF